MTTDGDLVPGARIRKLGDELKTVGDLEGPSSLVAVGAGGADVARRAAVRTETCVETAATFFLGQGGTTSAGGINVHPIRGRGLLLVLVLLLLLQAGLVCRGGGLGDEREARGVGGLAATAGGVGSGLVELDGDGCGNKSLKSRGEGTTAG